MFKLTVVSGPNRGASYVVQNGENSIGRQAGNTVVLQSAKVSKRHCVLVVSDDEVVMQDQGSSNGTFVNGVLAKSKKVVPGDRISVGEYIFELTQPQLRASRPAPAISGMGNVLQFPNAPRPATPVGSGMVSGTSSISISANQMPKDLKGRLLWILDHNIMPVFYSLNLKHEWRLICFVAFGIFAVGNLVISVYPLLEQNRENVVKESGRRAVFMAKQIAERNGPLLAARMETKSEIGSIANAEGVRLAVLTDLDNRILAPGSRLNQYLTSGAEAAFAVKAKNAFRGGRETGLVREVNDSTICAVEPVRIMSQTAGRNVTVGMAIVSIDTSLSTPDLGEMGMIYSEALILTALLGGILLTILYKITLKPFLTLNEDMDKALKGEMSQVTHEFKVEELNPLWDIINSALQRVPKGSASAGEFGGDFASAPSVDDYAGPLRMLGSLAQFGLVICDSDKKIIHINPMFEEISGIRADGAIGHDFASVARDQSLALFTQDLMERAGAGSEGASENYEFSGITYKCHAAGFGSSAGTVRCYVFAVTKAEG